MLRIRILTAADLPFADQVRGLAGWNQTPRDWERFIAHEPKGCFIAELDGQPVGTVTTTSYGTDLAWIGMMLVHPDFRRRGIATALMEAALEYLRGRDVRCIKLDATPDGYPVYEKLGFRPEWEFQRWLYTMPESYEPTPPDAWTDMVPRLDSYDKPIFGADRYPWLQRLIANSRVVIAAEEAYAMLRTGTRADYLGPSTATEPERGIAVVRQVLPHLRRDTFWDVPSPNEAALALAQEAGFQPVRRLIRMAVGEEVFGIPSLQFALGDPATG